MSAARLLLRGGSALFHCVVQAWTLTALFYWPVDASWAGPTMAAAYVLLTVGLLLRFRSPVRVSIIGFLLVALPWMAIEPDQSGAFPPETARLAWATFSDDEVTVHGVRNFRYRSDTDFTIAYEDRTYRLDDVRSVDLFVSYWDGHENIAHTFLSFGFTDGRFLTVSIEIRRETDETYDTLKGIFKQYEIIYVWGDERDIVKVRTNIRGEDVYCFRTTSSPRESRLLLVAMLEETTRLREQPVFYNTVTRNCTSSIVLHVNEVLPRKIPWWNRRLMNGYSARRAHAHGWIAGDGSFNDLKRRARITDRALASTDDAKFSLAIRRRPR